MYTYLHLYITVKKQKALGQTTLLGEADGATHRTVNPNLRPGSRAPF